MVTFIFFSISLSRSRYLNHEFCKLCLDKVFFLKKTFCFPFNFYWFFFFYFIQVGFVLYKNIYFETIFLVCSAMHTFFSFFIHSVLYIFIYIIFY